MNINKRQPNGLTARQQQFVVMVCQGIPRRDAYRQAGFGNRMNEKTCYEAASRMLAKPEVAAWRQQWLARARISDIDSPGAAVATTLHLINEATEDRNWTATAALQRLRYQHNGIAERTTVQIEATFSDADILSRLANNDPVRLAQLRSLLAPSSFDEPEVLELTATTGE